MKGPFFFVLTLQTLAALATNAALADDFSCENIGKVSCGTVAAIVAVSASPMLTPVGSALAGGAVEAVCNRDADAVCGCAERNDVTQHPDVSSGIGFLKCMCDGISTFDRVRDPRLEGACLALGRIPVTSHAPRPGYLDSGTMPEGPFRDADTGHVYYSNGQGAYCLYLSPEHYQTMQWRGWGQWIEIRGSQTPFASAMRNDGLCAVYLPAGNFRDDDTGGVYCSNGERAYCHFNTWPANGVAYHVHGGSNPYAQFMRFDGDCH